MFKIIFMSFIIPTIIVLLVMPGRSMGARLAGDDAPAVKSSAEKSASAAAPSNGKTQKNASQPAPAEKLPPEKTPIDLKSPSDKPVKEDKALLQGKPAAETTKYSTKSVKTPATKTKSKTGGAAKSSSKSKETKNSGRFVTIDFDNVDITVFIKFISEMTKRNFVIDDSVKGKVTVFSPKKVSVDDAYRVFQSVLEVHGYTTVPAGDIIKVIPSRDAKEKSIETRLKAEAVSPEDKIITQIVSLSYANPDEMKKILDPLVSKSSVVLSYPPTGMMVITDVQSNIKRLLNIISALDVAGAGETISVIPLKHASAKDMVNSLNAVFQLDQTQKRALSHTMKIVGDERTNMILVLATEVYTSRVKDLIALLDKEIPQGESKMHVYRLQYANAEDLAKILMNLPAAKDTKTTAQPGKTQLLSSEIQVVADKATNTLIITAVKDDYIILEDVIRKVDVSRPMVYIEALIMEVDVTKDFKLGVEWRTANNLGTIPGFDTGQAAVIAGSGGLGSSSTGGYAIIPDSSTTPTFPSGFTVGVIGAGITIGGVTFPNIGAVLQAVQKDKDVHILSNPQLLTSDNEEASITVGKNIPYVTRQEKSQANVDYSNYEYKDVGVMLTVTPTINTERFVKLKIAQEVTQVVTSESSVGLPTTLKRAAKTTVSIKDGNTVVIGGIIGDSTDMSTYKVPCLGDIPLLGWLFRSNVKTRDKTNLYVFLTPRIIEQHEEASAIAKEKRKEIESYEGGVIKTYIPKSLKKEEPEPPKKPE